MRLAFTWRKSSARDLGEGEAVVEENIFPETAAEIAERLHRFTLAKELLTAPALGTS
jgi:hypothetical protein